MMLSIGITLVISSAILSVVYLLFSIKADEKRRAYLEDLKKCICLYAVSSAVFLSIWGVRCLVTTMLS